MNENKLKKLFASAQQEIVPAPPEDFAADVLRAIRHEPQITGAETFSLFDQLNLLFPRIAVAAAVIILLCVAADYGATAAGMPGLEDGAAQLSAQQLLPSETFSL